jgi:predicted ester cyclase
VVTEQDKAALRRIPKEIFGEGKLAVADEVVAPDYIEHVSLPPGMPTGIPGLKAFVAGLRAAFPDFKYIIEDEFAEGDRVVQRLTASGTHQGEFLGMPATGKKATWSEIHMGRVAGGKLIEHWANSDQMGMLQQLGISPTPGQAGS